MLAILESNGNVTFKLEGDDGEILERFQEQVQRNADHEVLASLLDYFGFMGNARYIPIQPEHIGALTDAPMFTDCLELFDDGHSEVIGDVWWYPDYAVSSFSEVLKNEGQVTFAKAKK